MTQALFTSMTGLNAGTQQLTVVSDNIANMNTTAYKTSRLDFQDIWYQTKTSGTNSTRVTGGTNPYQIGVGVQCASITKDFGASNTNTTGRTEDMAITGNGWFTVLNSDGKVLLTRDGTFSLDENGYVCTANGNKVLGMYNLESLTGSTTPLKLPTSVKVVEQGTPKATFESTKCDDLNSLGISDKGLRGGTFKVTVNENGTETELTIDIGDPSTQNMQQLATTINAGANGKFTATVEDGTLKFTPTAANTTLTFETIEEKEGGSNIVAAMGLASATQAADGSYSTKILNISVNIGQVDDITSEYTKNYESFSVGQDGLVTVKYSDGSSLSVKMNDQDGVTYFSYTTAGGVIVDDDASNSGNMPLYVDPNVLVKANMQIQLAKVVNDGGLVAEGNNQYSIGSNCGQVLYTTAKINGVGGVVTGALEASNVDLAQQFSNMILAQRLVQANSQVFSGANSLLETLVYLGR